MVVNQLREIIAKAAGISLDQVHLEHPDLDDHGDYSTNLALTLKGGRQKAEEIAGKIHSATLIDKVEVAGPGFINIWLKQDYLIAALNKATNLPKGALGGKKVMVEFTDPNPFKEFHIGHLYSNVVGETLSRLFESQGADVWRVCYQGDVGMHVAKSVWGMQHMQQDMPKETDSTAHKAEYLGKAYALGATRFEEDEEVKKAVTLLNKQIYNQEASVKEVYMTGKRWSLEYFDTIYERLGTKFKKHYFESDAGKVGLEYVRQYLQKGVFKESDGAVIFPGEDYGLHTRVFINSQGLPTYEAKELGLAPTKYQDFPYDLSVIVTGNEIDEYFKVLLKALEQVNPELGAKTKHLSHGMVRLPSGKMSSRTGKVLTGEWLMNEAAKKVAEIAPDNPDPDKIGLAAIKYALLKSGIGHDTEFDFEESVSFDGNSGPYLQYTYARTQSILKKASVAPHTNKTPTDRLSPEEIAIVRFGYRYSEIVAEAASRYAPNLLTTYLYELAQRFNTFYNKHTILGNEFRVGLTGSVGEIIKSGLHILGIAALERM